MRYVLMLLIVGLSVPTEASVDASRKIRVRLESSLSSVRLHGMSWSVNGRLLAKSPLAMNRLEIQRRGREWSLAVDGITRVMTGRELILRGEGIRSAFKTYPGVVVLRARGGSTFELQGEWPLSDYLAGVLAGEMPLSWPLEALKAQAVAARSYALASLKRREAGAALEPTVMDQVFRWPLPEKERRRALEAVRATDGVVLRDPGGEVARAHYHADCGGRTLAASDVWSGGEDTGTVSEASCPLRSRSRWSHRLTKADLARRLRILLGPVDPGTLALEPVSDGGRIRSVKIAASGKSLALSGDRFRHLIGVSELRSTAFTVRDDGASWFFSGAGFGHGVGLCQWGSRELGLRGESAERILAHYYPRLRIGQLSP